MSSSMSHRLAMEIRRDIVAGIFQPGTRLKTMALAEHYKVSANPVREALWRLQGEGFVVASPNMGARVRVVDDDFIRNIFEVRELIEPTFVKRFCSRASDSDLDRLEEAHERFAAEAAGDSLDFYKLDQANRAFHGVIVEKESNKEAIQVIERYGDIINAARAKLALTRGRAMARAKQHGVILDALRQGDAAAAAEAAAIHIRDARDDHLEQLKQLRVVAAS